MTTLQEDHDDINDAFEKILFCEEIAEEVGYTEGYAAGKNKIINGYHLGYHRASLLAARLGYYYGIVEYCLNKKLFSDKVILQAKKLHSDLVNFPRNNDLNIDILKTVDDIKFKYIKLCSLAKIDSSYPESEELDF